MLGLNHTPDVDAHFFKLGGDSLASVEMIVACEARFGRTLDVNQFLNKPTLGNLQAAIEQAVRSPLNRQVENPNGGLLRKIKAHMANWPGEQALKNGWIVGTNLSGCNPPIYWVFQTPNEFESLGRALGPEQPLYGMRSLAGHVPTAQYTPDRIAPLCVHYLEEICQIQDRSSPVMLGGNCQGSIIALAIARQLQDLGFEPDQLVLMEWSFSKGGYDGPTLILYGEESVTAPIYQDDYHGPPYWREEFPNRKVASIRGGHGAFFSAENVNSLSDQLRRSVIKSTKIRSETGDHVSLR